MTRAEFRDLLETARPQAVRMLMRRQVAQWFEGGSADVTEAVAKWADSRLDMGDDNVLIRMAQAVDLVEE